VTESRDNNKWIARIYDTATWKEIAKFEDARNFFIFSADGKRAAISAYGKTLIVDLKQLHRFPTDEKVKEYIEKKQAEKK
jgi:hypothetical protein